MNNKLKIARDLIRIARELVEPAPRMRRACLHTEVFRNLGVDESELPNHTAYYAKRLLEIARMLAE